MRDRLLQVVLFFLTVAKVMNEDQRIAVCKTSVSQIYEMLRRSPQQWRSFLTLARSVMGHIDTTTFMQQANRTAEQAWLVAGLQRLAYADADNGGVQDIAHWCSRQWLVIFHRDPNNVAALRGIGQAWLWRAQPTLARIHRQDGSGSSSGGSGGSQISLPILSNEQESALMAQQTAEAERKAGTADFVEARGYLQPATEYLERAVAAATAQQQLSGDLLAMAAEAYMSLGNTSSPRVNEQSFRRAIQLLRAASAVPGYVLTRYLQQYLNDYGRLTE
ncbi:hypothetical protein K431DRAFT_28228 [Polychaeton citri CBS 116435]|uniref:Uncharacterized protein n=1 Tax=Polychaeton citri CBS 116435 TaxID=1314669 RepID=A0A9P4UPC3_9PEZI|nr:hypothetical protein K431DRAFT_28228 [Polychaeton citri CBS 116435]